MVSANIFNPKANNLVIHIKNTNTLNTGEKVAICSNTHLELTDLLVKGNYNIQTFYEFGQIKRAIQVENYMPKTVILNWSDRDVWRLFEILPVHIKILSLYQPVFKTGLDHKLNAKFIQGHIGQSEDDREDGRLFSWDNRLYIYNFQT